MAESSEIIDKDEISKILIIKVSALGDIVRTFPALISIARLFPNAKISYMIGSQYVELIEPCPYVTEIIPYEKRKNLEDLGGMMKLAKDIRAKGFDLVLNFQNTKRFDYLAKLSGAKHRSRIIELDRPMDGVEGIFEIMKTVGLRPVRRYYEFWFSKQDHEFLNRFFVLNGLSGKDRIVGINPAAGWLSKQWPVERYADLADRLIGQTGAKVIVFGSAEERNRADSIAEMMKNPVAIAAGETSIREAACLISKCAVFVSNDSGLMHVAAVQDIPTVGIFGSTNPAYHGPCREGNLTLFKGVDCSPCYDPVCRLDFEKYYCMKAVKTEEVMSAVKQIMH